MLKNDSEQIRSFLYELANQPWLHNDERRVWPRFAYHFTDIQNAIRILEKGYLYSRTYLEENNLLTVSSGSQSILANTDEWVKSYVRLYFRPKTPTQYWMEGVKSKAVLGNSSFSDAHCPIPIFFLFDLYGVLSLESTAFSDRGLNRGDTPLLFTAEELRKIDWHKTYHNSRFDRNNPDEQDITARRNAEIIVPERLDLKLLRYIYCRSNAERETLLHLWPSGAPSSNSIKIISSSRSEHFFREHTFLNDVRMSSEQVRFYFSPDTKSVGPFDIRIEFRSLSGEHPEVYEFPHHYIRHSSGRYERSIRTPAREYLIRVYLDHSLVYANGYSFREENMPF